MATPLWTMFRLLADPAEARGGSTNIIGLGTEKMVETQGYIGLIKVKEEGWTGFSKGWRIGSPQVTLNLLPPEFHSR